MRNRFSLFTLVMLIRIRADWTSAVGWNDTAAHGNVDFLPWFLGEMKKAEKTAGRRLLDYLDIHYYFQADTSSNTDAAKAIRLRATRSLWVCITIAFSRFISQVIFPFDMNRIQHTLTIPGLAPSPNKTTNPTQPRLTSFRGSRR